MGAATKPLDLWKWTLWPLSAEGNTLTSYPNFWIQITSFHSTYRENHLYISISDQHQNRQSRAARLWTKPLSVSAFSWSYGMIVNRNVSFWPWTLHRSSNTLISSVKKKFHFCVLKPVRPKRQTSQRRLAHRHQTWRWRDECQSVPLLAEMSSLSSDFCLVISVH